MANIAKGSNGTSPVFDTDADNVIQFTAPTTWSKLVYFRLVGQQFTADSIITVNQEID